MIEEIPVEIRWKNVRKMYLYVKPPEGRVTVTAPLQMDEETVARFLTEKLPWIRSHRARMAARAVRIPALGTDGATLPVWGNRYTLDVKESPQDWSLHLEEDRAVLFAPSDVTQERWERFLREWYRDRLKEETARRLPEWSRRTGLFPNEWRTRDMTTRWGSCNPIAGRIWLNVQLARYPSPCLDYVILHELLHLRVPNHGSAFRTLLNQYMPQWKQVRAALNGR